MVPKREVPRTTEVLANPADAKEHHTSKERSSEIPLRSHRIINGCHLPLKSAL